MLRSSQLCHSAESPAEEHDGLLGGLVCLLSRCNGGPVATSPALFGASLFCLWRVAKWTVAQIVFRVRSSTCRIE